jgi:hypothetical protein
MHVWERFLRGRREQRERVAQTSSLPSLFQIDRSGRFLVALGQTRFGPWLVSANLENRQKIEMRPPRRPASGICIVKTGALGYISP